MKFDTSLYEKVYGMKPSGFGLWVFEARGKTYTVPETMSYPMAKTWAKKTIKGFEPIKVLP
jgi:hypothetical protein